MTKYSKEHSLSRRMSRAWSSALTWVTSNQWLVISTQQSSFLSFPGELTDFNSLNVLP